MKKYAVAVAGVVFLASSLICVPAYAGDNIIDKTSDWCATRGKHDPEKSMILAGRRTERAAKRADKEMKKAANCMKKDIKRTCGR